MELWSYGLEFKLNFSPRSGEKILPIFSPRSGEKFLPIFWVLS